jgi:hypothetical protein
VDTENPVGGELQIGPEFRLSLPKTPAGYWNNVSAIDARPGRRVNLLSSYQEHWQESKMKLCRTVHCAERPTPWIRSLFLGLENSTTGEVWRKGMERANMMSRKTR